jgi:hypothetical protein
MLITAIASCQIKAGNLGSWPNNKKYGEKDERKNLPTKPIPHS